ncbi:MAG: hypothetical protein EA377_10680 [Phycisphaerales bacterium]|nr:MAG: hypothetical protein EA377_10680 [Phycisphaerales bacterium]
MLMLMLAALSLTASPAAADDDELTAVEILDQVRERYASVSDHAESGRLIYEFELERRSFAIERSATLRFQRDMYMTMEYESASGCENATLGLRLTPSESIVMAEGDAVRVRHAADETDEEDIDRIRDLTIRLARMYADPLTLEITPTLLQPERFGRGLFDRMINLRRGEDVNFRGTPCYQIRADGPEGEPVQILVNQHDFTIARVRHNDSVRTSPFGRVDSLRVTYIPQQASRIEARNEDEIPALRTPRTVSIRDVTVSQIELRPALRDGVLVRGLSLDELRSRLWEIGDERQRARIEAEGLPAMEGATPCLQRDLYLIMEEMRRRGRQQRR